MNPTPTNGKICYIEMPATDIRRSAEFYEKVFGWRIRKRGDGATAFDDTTGQVSGSWVAGRGREKGAGLGLERGRFLGRLCASSIGPGSSCRPRLRKYIVFSA